MNRIMLFASTQLLVLAIGLLLPSNLPTNASSNNTLAADSGVWYVSPAGSDSGTCSTAVDPCSTIYGALGKATAGDTIYVSAGTYTSSLGDEVLLVYKSVTLSGGWDSTFAIQNGISVVDGQNARRGITVQSGVTATIKSFSAQNGNNSIAAGLYNNGSLTLQDCVIQNNINGRGIVNDAGSDMTLIGCIVEGNYVNDQGGGIWNSGTMTLIRTAVNGNTASSSGGGLHNVGVRLTLINSTVSDNTGAQGGGIDTSYGELRLYNSTIIHNSATIYTGGLDIISGNILVQNSIIADNHAGTFQDAPPDCRGAISSGGYNLIGNTFGCGFNATTGDMVNVSPHAFEVGNYYALLPMSPAIDTGNPGGCTDNLGNPIVEDQRRSLRPQDGNNDGTSRCDIGAYEFDPANPTSQIFIPLASRPPMIFGNVILANAPISGITVELRFYNDTDWSTVATASTDAYGHYEFNHVAPTGSGQVYYVRYQNTDDATRLYTWHTRVLTSLTPSSSVDLGTFDIANVLQTAPASGANVKLPYTFKWTTRSATPTDSYEFDLLDASDHDPWFYTDPSLGFVGSYKLAQRPPGFLNGVVYAWEVAIISPDGGYGVSYYYFNVKFNSSPGGLAEIQTYADAQSGNRAAIRGWAAPGIPNDK